MRQLFFILLLSLTHWPVGWAGGEWQGQLLGGGTVRIDPATNRATVTRDGASTQLWDGNHRLQDGSILIIRSGRAVPNHGVLHGQQKSPEVAPEQRKQWEGAAISGNSPCENLVRRVCGAANQCGKSGACEPARQLRAMESSERDAAGNRTVMTFTSGKCQASLADIDFFRPCAQAPAGSEKPAAHPRPASK